MMNSNGHGSTESNGTEVTSNGGSATAASVDNNVYHKLDCSWTIWLVDPSKKINTSSNNLNTTSHHDYMSSLENLGSFDTVEDFWILYHKLKLPSRMAPDSTYHLFKTGINPTWEDPINVNGGKWVLAFQGNNRVYNDIDTIWENIVLGVVGETIDTERDICGLVLTKRDKLERISVWNRDSSNAKGIDSLRVNILETLPVSYQLNPKLNFKYQKHEDMSTSKGSIPLTNSSGSTPTTNTN